jgi:Flp pilus assembly protein TadG
MRRSLLFARRLWRNRRGATAITVTLMMTFIIGMAGFVVDVGHMIYVQRQLQAATDAAALAGAHDINCCSSAPGTATGTANAYSAIPTGKNALAGGVTASMATGFPKLKCFASTGVSCTGPDNANGIVVKEQATVPTWFASVLGFKSFNVAATSTAGAQGGPAKKLDIMLVLDTTASMNTADSSCSISGATRLTCAEAGVRTLLNKLSFQADYIGLQVYPGLTSATLKSAYSCGSTTPSVLAYKSSPNYGVLGLGNDFQTSGSTSLNSSSNIVKAAGGVSGCSGMTAKGGVGTFFADAIDNAQATLTSTGRANVQKVIIILSDGDAGSSSTNMTTAKYHNQCAQAVTEAQKATAAGTWVYTIAYGASTSTTGSCAVDSPHISACTTMQNMASTPKYFYSDQTGGSSSCTSSAQSVSELVSIFAGIGASFGTPRLIPDDST